MLFATIYNEPWDLPQGNEFQFPYIKKLVALADQYCCLRTVSGTVELGLLKSDDLSSHIAKHPLEYVELARKIRSGPIYQDAFVHLVGRLDSFWDQKHQLHPVVLEDVLDEYHRISKLKSTVDRYAVSVMAFPRLFESEKLDISPIGAAFDVFICTRDNGEGNMYRRMRGCFDSMSEAYRNRRIGNPSFDSAQHALRQLVSSSLMLCSTKEHDHLTCASTQYDYPWNDDEKW
jgi:hypothetical protein